MRKYLRNPFTNSFFTIFYCEFISLNAMRIIKNMQNSCSRVYWFLSNQFIHWLANKYAIYKFIIYLVSYFFNNKIPRRICFILYIFFFFINSVTDDVSLLKKNLQYKYWSMNNTQLYKHFNAYLNCRLI